MSVGVGSEIKVRVALWHPWAPLGWTSWFVGRIITAGLALESLMARLYVWSSWGAA